MTVHSSHSGGDRGVRAAKAGSAATSSEDHQRRGGTAAFQHFQEAGVRDTHLEGLCKTVGLAPWVLVWVMLVLTAQGRRGCAEKDPSLPLGCGDNTDGRGYTGSSIPSGYLQPGFC